MKIIALLHGIIAEIYYSVILLSLRFVRHLWHLLRGRPLGLSAPSGPDQGRAILLLHGLSMDDSNFWFLRRRLAKDGWGPIYTYTFDRRRIGLQDQGQALHLAIQKLAAQHGPVDIIGHSMGGVIARFVIQDFGARPLVRSLVTLASSHDGTPMAKLTWSRSGRDLRPDSPFMQGLRTSETRWVGDLPTLLLYSNLDFLVSPTWGCPKRNSPLGGHCFIPNHGHMSILCTQTVYEKIRDFLREVGNPRGVS